MNIRRWRRSTEAKPDEIRTKSIFHIPGLSVHAVPESRENLAFMTGQYRHARCFSSCESTRYKWAQTGMSRRWFCPDLHVVEVTEHPKRFLSVAPHHWSGQLHPGIWTFVSTVVARLVRQCGQVHATQRFHSLFGRLSIGFFPHPEGTWAHSKEHERMIQSTQRKMKL